MQSNAVIAEPAAKPLTRMESMKIRALMALAAVVPFAGLASAAVNFTTIEELLAAVTGLIPSFMDLVVEIAPLIVTIAIIGFVLSFLDRILAWLKF